ncbi:MAG TPA: pyridoxal-phosphate dependent enzyme [Ktedonobacteraceae bacterium]|nr:pyridoxal-phosphate dependent enzyme [Ktedonobacteraceae bacterium]
MKFGETYDESKLHCEALAHDHSYRYIHSGDEPLLIAGVGTEGLEMLEDQPDLDIIFVPIGGGSGAAGVSIAAHTINPSIQIIGVQSEASPAAYETWKQHQLVTAPNRTFAEGLATGLAFELPQAIMRDHLHDFLLLSEEEIMRAMVWMIERAHTLAEGAGAASLAAAYRVRDTLQGKKVGLICSGGNTSLEHLKRALAL